MLEIGSRSCLTEGDGRNTRTKVSSIESESCAVYGTRVHLVLEVWTVRNLSIALALYRLFLQIGREFKQTQTPRFKSSLVQSAGTDTRMIILNNQLWKTVLNVV